MSASASSSSQDQNKPVLITGFGPFMDHKVNASWQAVLELNNLGVEHQSKPVKLEVREIPVAYTTVSEGLPKIYKEVKPRLTVHVGVSPYKVIKLEKFGRNTGYKALDIHGHVPPTKKCVEDGPESICSSFDVEGVCKTLSHTQNDVTFETSNDAGRYLCDFIYYTSLHLAEAPVIFVHVPPLQQPYSAQQLGVALQRLVKILLDELCSSAV